MNSQSKDSFRSFSSDVFKRSHIMQLNSQPISEDRFKKFVKSEIIPKADMILVDLLWKGYRQAVKLRFTVEQIATFLSIANYIFLESFAAKMVHLESYALLKKILNNHTFQAPPFCIGIFTQEDVQHINKFMRNYFYRYFSLYETTQNIQCEYTIATQQQTEDWPLLADLSEGTIVNPNTIKLLQLSSQQYISEQPVAPDSEEELAQHSDLNDQALRILETKDNNNNIQFDKKLEDQIERQIEMQLNLKTSINNRNNAIFDLLDDKDQKKK